MWQSWRRTASVALVCVTLICLRCGLFGSKPRDWAAPTKGMRKGPGCASWPRGFGLEQNVQDTADPADYSDVTGSSIADSEASQRFPDSLSEMLHKVRPNNTPNQWNEFQRNNKGRCWSLDVMLGEYFKFLNEKASQKAKEGISARQRRVKNSQ